MLKSTLCLVLTLFAADFGQGKRIDICGVSRKLYDEGGGRDLACGVGQHEHQGLCDSERPKGWYQVYANSDTDPFYKPVNMPTVCPKVGQCGANNPLWLNGSLPSVEEDVVQLAVCMVGESGCCEKTFPIYVLNCTTFFAYYLEPTPDCSTRYCFGNSEECPHKRRTPNPDTWETTTRPPWDRTARSYWETTPRPSWDRTTSSYWETTPRPSWDRTTQPWWDRTTQTWWDRTTQPWWDRTTQSRWDKTTKPWWDRTTQPWWDRTTQSSWDRTTKPWWDRTTQPWWDRTTQPWWDRTTQSWWDRTTQPWWDRTTQSWWDRTTQSWWDRTTKPWWDRTTQSWWDRTTRPWWEKTTQPSWDRTTRPWGPWTTQSWWDRTTKPWWYSTTFEPRPEDAWERRYRHLLQVSRRNTILSGITLLLVVVTFVSMISVAICKCRKRRRNNYAMFQPALIGGAYKI